MALAEKDLYMKIGRPRNTCVSCGAAIAHAGRHPSVLRRGGGDAADGNEQAEGPHREDYCEPCWQELAERDFVGFWVTRREPPKQRKIETRKERNAAMVAWFEHLRDQNPDEEIRQSLFFLAHLLMKYGVFKWQRTETRDDGSEVIIFRATGSEDEIEITAVDFSDERSVEIKRELDEFLLQYANAQPEEDANTGGRATEDEPESDS